MNEHAGASCALSVLIVGVFAVLLHDRAPSPRSPASQPEATARIDVEPPAAPEAEPAPTPAEPPAVVTPAPPPQLAPVQAPIVPRKAVAPVQPPAAEIPAIEAPRPVIKPRVAIVPPRPPIAPKRVPRRAASSFTEVEAGETLADVSARVYGTADLVESLWKANRDQLAKLDSPLGRGTLLRTP